jgi:DNA-directed RNA polymerase beta subunit
MSIASDAEGELLRQVLIAKGLSQPVLDSVNHFYKYGIEKILSSYTIRTLDGSIGRFKDPYIERPIITDIKTKQSKPLWPYEARRNSLSYMARLFATFEMNNQSTTLYLGKIPAIVQSEVCRLYGLTEEQRYQRGEPEKDPGAYAIIEGQEKVILNIENLRSSESFLYQDKKDFIVRYTGYSLTAASIVVIKEVSTGREEFTYPSIHTTFSRLGLNTNTINIFIIFYILGFSTGTVEKTLKEIENFIIDDDLDRQTRRRRQMRYYIQPTIVEFDNLTRGSEDLVYKNLSDKVYDPEIKNSPQRNTLLMQFIWKEFFPNIPLKYTNETEIAAILLAKIRILASMIAKYIDFKNGYREPDDRDAWGNKRLIDTGEYLTRGFNYIWSVMITDISSKFAKLSDRNFDRINNMINKNQMAQYFIQSYNKNMFTVGKGKYKRENIVGDTLNRDNILASISHIRRISTPTNDQAKIREKRLIHNSQWGVACPVFTPEGGKCGLSKDSAITTYVSLNRDEAIVRAYLDGRQIKFGARIVSYGQGTAVQTVEGTLFATPPEAFQIPEGITFPANTALYSTNPTTEHKYPLYLNGVPLGFCNSTALRETLIQLRRSQKLYFDTGIILNYYKELKIFTNDGRICRPLLIVDRDTDQLVIDTKNLRGSNLSKLMSEGAIEYIDVAEQEQIQILIAVDVRQLRNFIDELSITREQYETLSNDPNTTQTQLSNTLKELVRLQNRMKYTHCEIDPTAIMGLSAITMPFPEFNQTARTVFQSNMVRQALGGNSSRVELRFDSTLRTILEPGIPTVTTDAHQYLGLDQYPGGRELIIAISTYGGSNQEDAITFNKAAIDMGLFMMMIFHSYETTLCQSSNHEEVIKIPEYSPNQAKRYSKLDIATGIVRLNEYVVGGDCLVGKVIKENGKEKNDSLYVERGKDGIVDEISITENAENCKLIRIRIRELRKLQPGDKLASRYSQKGTIGAILPERDMPWIASDNPHLNNVRPHIIFNPHGIPSRMTIGKLYEMIVGKVTSVTGERFNATAFRRFGQPVREGEPPRDNLDVFKEQLELMGFSRSGKETMIAGTTGVMMEAEIFVGTTYYQLLRHLVKDKMQARGGTGSFDFLTHQPTKGMRRGGGTKIGEMERDALLEYGANNLLQERMIISSDAYQAVVCKQCRLFATTNIETGEPSCSKCNFGTFTRVRIPYTFKLLSNYLSAANMKVSVRTKEI